MIISSKGDYINNVLNDRDGGEYTMEHLTQNAMNCLKDPKGSIEKPKREFFKIEDVKLSNDELCEGRKEFMLRRNKKKNFFSKYLLSLKSYIIIKRTKILRTLIL